MTPMEDRIVGTFIMKSTDRAEVRAPMASFLTAVNAGEGDDVAAGKLISEMEVPGLQSDIAQVQAEIAEIRAKMRILGASEKDSGTPRFGKLKEYKAELEFARKNFNKAQVLLKKGAIGDQQFRLLEKEYHVWDSQYQQLLAEQDAERAHLARSQEKMRYLKSVAASLRLEAPIDGTIVTSDLSRSVGRYFEEGDIIFEVANPKRLEAELSIPEQDMIHLQAGQQVELKIFALPYQTINTRVTRIAPMVNTSVQDQNKFEATPLEGVQVYSQLEQVIPELVPGMTGYARITLQEQYAAAVLAKRLMRFIRTEFWW
jgi:multidrug efflux pump subunit AcrA (membrane-fusion protein)